MPQQWNRSYPLHLLDAFLTGLVSPFTRAKRIEVYATHGYYLLGIVLFIATCLLWELGLLGVILSQLPPWLRDIPVSTFGPFWRKFLPESIPFIAVLGLLYWILFFIKRFRMFIGERFANLFFGTMNLGIMAGEWCLEHRWSSLFIVIILAGYITWGTVYFFGAVNRGRRLEDKFKIWFEQVNNFSARNTMTNDETAKYQREVSTFWDVNFSDITRLSSNHPAFTLHKMLETLYPDSQVNPNWIAFRDANRDYLQKLVDDYKPPALQKMTDEEKRSWAWMNILLGRIYTHECEEKNDYSLCAKATDLFGKVVELDSSTNDKNEEYLIAAHNGRGTAFNLALLNQAARAICPNDVTCANNAVAEFAAAGGTTCSFLGQRRENNTIDLLLRVGFWYNELDKAKYIKLSEVCHQSVGSEAALAECIEHKVQEVMTCTTQSEFIPTLYITAAQAYGVSAKLRLVKPDTDVRLEAKSAGHYLRLAYMFNDKSRMDKEHLFYLDAFQTDIEPKCPPPAPQNYRELLSYYQKKDYKCAFWDAVAFGFDDSFRISWEEINRKIKENLDDKNQK